LENQIDFYGLLTRMIMAIIAGGVIGFERQTRNRYSGIRTYSLISLSSAYISYLAVKSKVVLGINDVSMLLVGVLLSMGFLGSGMVYRLSEEKNVIRGLTSASALIITSIIGIGFGLGLFLDTMMIFVLTILCMVGFRYLEVKYGLKKTKETGSQLKKTQENESQQ